MRGYRRAEDGDHALHHALVAETLARDLGGACPEPRAQPWIVINQRTVD